MATKQKYLLGVDGGNSKTDYMLCREDGTFVDILRRPPCSHEQMPTGYEGAKEVMRSHLNGLFAKNRINVEDIAAAAFGLAGADLPEQIDVLYACVQSLGFSKFTVANDGILGIKAIAETGICTINGAGTVVVGINPDGKMLQVGGVGQISGDYAGGSHIARSGVGAVYNHFYRMGEYTAILPEILSLFGVCDTAGLQKVAADGKGLLKNATEIIKIIDNAAIAGDKIAAKILDDVGINCAEGVCGLIRCLPFDCEILVVKAGSIWHRLQYPGMTDCFTDFVLRNTTQDIRFVLLDSPPVLGGIFWAKEQHHGPIEAKYREEMLSYFSAEKYNELV